MFIKMLSADCNSEIYISSAYIMSLSIVKEPSSFGNLQHYSINAKTSSGTYQYASCGSFDEAHDKLQSLMGAIQSGG